MAVHQSKHQSDLEKRLKILRQQFYGNQPSSPSGTHSYRRGLFSSENQLLDKTETSDDTRLKTDDYSISDMSYLRADLMKISILAGTVLGLQIILYFLIKNNVLNINLF